MELDTDGLHIHGASPLSSSRRLTLCALATWHIPLSPWRPWLNRVQDLMGRHIWGVKGIFPQCMLGFCALAP